ncbi:MAG: antibiotic biosynthesis monooxygenase [Alistipes sp.]|nr:antibiotic biosynthesis monooxygenase [Alistipes sp.]
MKRVLMALLALAFAACGQQSKVDMQEKYENRLVRLSKIEVYEEYLDDYLSFVGEVGRTSVEQEEGVLTLFSVQERERPCHITILEIYADRAAYEHHIATPHFQKYKQGTLHMVKSLELCDGKALVPDMLIKNK